MKKIVIGIFIVFLYCFPYVYFSMYQDNHYRSMRGYLIMIVVTFLLAFFSKLFSGLAPIFIGNIASGIISFHFNKKMTGVGNWDYYFEPFPSVMLLVIVTALNFLLQLLAVMLANKFNNKT